MSIMQREAEFENQPELNLSECDREPIHLLGQVQDYGCLISTTSDMIVNHVSENCREFLKLDPHQVIGLSLGEILPRQTIRDFQQKADLDECGSAVLRLFAYDVLKDGSLFDVSIHASGRSLIFEFEAKKSKRNRNDLALIQPLMQRVKRHKKLSDAATEAAKALAGLSGFGRVMIYQFAPDGSGEVIAEHRSPDMEPFIGLRYPESDIPKQARALYKKNIIRLISDVNGKASDIVPELSSAGEPLDLSFAVTRAVSPVHMQYLRNMGVGASLSASILQNGELWGLFACHHPEPRYLDYERRTAIELFSQLFSFELESKLEAEIRRDEQQARELHDRMMIRLSAGDGLIDSFDTIAEELAGIVPSDGVALFSDGKYISKGVAPTEQEFAPLCRFLNTAPTGTVITTDNLVSVYPDARAFAEEIAGVMAVPVSRTPRDYIVFFRREIIRSVRWAGKPEKAVEVGPNGGRLTPRASFAAWTNTVRDTSEPWTAREIRAAEAFRVSLIEIVLKLTEEANNERRQAAEKQELLIAELNHRVRNILNLIQSLVAHTSDGAADISSYTSTLSGRIQAMARAHDQLTRQEWDPTSLRELISVEVNAYLHGQSDRIEIRGDSPLITPEAFSALALVVHELVTNAVKYGALASEAGKISVDLRIVDDGALMMDWRERGGPAVTAPSQRGFGSTLIERTVPFELKGKAETSYSLPGFEARFVIPSPYILKQFAEPAKDGPVVQGGSKEMNGALSGTALVLEDSMAIALYASRILSSAGADEVEQAGSVKEAQRILAKKEIRFAVLDVNLGDETSLPIADHLQEMGVPFILATGYADVEKITDSYKNTAVIPKPYTEERLVRLIQRSLHQAVS